eukprot:scaffold63808_cov32-Prasinocladus_malaysianus.AAC.1
MPASVPADVLQPWQGGALVFPDNIGILVHRKHRVQAGKRRIILSNVIEASILHDLAAAHAVNIASQPFTH